MGVVCDFYNLELASTESLNKNWVRNRCWQTPEEDKEKILDFFQEHAPDVLKYQKAEEIDALSKPIDAFEITGTLGMYEYAHRKTWFESNDARKFYFDYSRLRALADNYLQNFKVSKAAMSWVIKFAGTFSLSVLISNKLTGTQYSVSTFPEKEVDLSRHAILTGQSSAGLWNLATYELARELYKEIEGILKGIIQIDRCYAGGCDKIFIRVPGGKEQRYCSNACKQRAYRERQKKTLMSLHSA